jgi:ligand-binding sensor domain-containing protein
MILKNNLLVLLTLFTPLSSILQELNAWHYELSDGLPSTSLYNVMIDSKGMVWFGSDYGATCYDGATFKTYTTDDGLSDNTVIKCFEDSHGRIWFHHVNKAPSYLLNGKIKILQGENLSAESNGNFVELPNGYILLGGIGGVIIIDPAAHAYFYDANIDERVITTFYDEKGLHFFCSQHLETTPSKIKLINEYEHMMPFLLLKNKVKYSALFLSYRYFLKNDHHNLTMNRIDDFFKSIENADLFYVEQRDNLIYCCSTNGLYIFKDENGKIEFEEHRLAGKGIPNLAFDKSGGLWLTTINNGLFFYPNQEYSVFKELEKEIVSSLFVDHESLYIGTNDGKVFEQKNSEPDLLNELNTATRTFNRIRDIDFQQDELILTTGGGYVKWDKKSPGSLNDHFYPLNVNMIESHSLPKSKAVITNSDTEVLVYDFESDSMLSKTRHRDIGRILKINCTNDQVLIGSQTGLAVIPLEQNPDFEIKQRYNIGRVNDILANENQLILATGGSGLVVIQGSDTLHFGEYNGLISNTIKKLAHSTGNSFWIASDIGIQLVEISNGQLRELQRIDIKNVFQAIDVMCMVEFNNSLMVSLNNGFYKIPVQRDLKIKQLALTVDYLSISDSVFSFKSEIATTYDQNNLKIKLTSIDFSPHPIKYSYRINDQPWEKTTSNSLLFPALSSGDYSFEIYAETMFKDRSDVIHFNLHIGYPWWLNKYLIISFLLVIAFLIVTYVKWIKTRITTRREQKLFLELKALQSQMNPHFTFNSLNSISRFIGENDQRSAQIYLAEFAQLMRRILDQSGVQLIRLSDEIDFLSCYIQLEQMRLNQKFEFNLEIDESVDSDWDTIPSMLLQPFVENAIWHGLVPAKHKGLLTIKFCKKSDELICEIIDNGIGIHESRETKTTKTHHSKGMQITEDRIKLFQEIYKKKIVFTVSDNRASSNSSGTTVLIKFQKFTEL